MRAGSVKHLARSGAAVCVLFLNLCHIGPQLARAACSHLVGSERARSFDWNQLDRLIVGDSSSLAWDDPLYPSQTPDRRPCSGLSCSSKVPVSSSTASRTSAGSDHWGDRTTFMLDQIDVPTGMTMCADSPHSQFGTLAIFRPPPV
jgi:hypothetical protein